MNTVTDARTWIDNAGLDLSEEEATRLTRPLWDVCTDWGSVEPTFEDLTEAMEQAGFDMGDWVGDMMLLDPLRTSMDRREDVVEERVNDFYDDVEETRLREAHGESVREMDLAEETEYCRQQIGVPSLDESIVAAAVSALMGYDVVVFEDDNGIGFAWVDRSGECRHMVHGFSGKELFEGGLQSEVEELRREGWYNISGVWESPDPSLDYKSVGETFVVIAEHGEEGFRVFRDKMGAHGRAALEGAL